MGTIGCQPNIFLLRHCLLCDRTPSSGLPLFIVLETFVPQPSYVTYNIGWLIFSTPTARAYYRLYTTWLFRNLLKPERLLTQHFIPHNKGFISHVPKLKYSINILVWGLVRTLSLAVDFSTLTVNQQTFVDTVQLNWWSYTVTIRVLMLAKQP